MGNKRLYILGGDYNDETHQFEFLIVTEEYPPVPGGEVIVDRTVIVRLLEKGHCLQALPPMKKAVYLVKVAGIGYLRTDQQEVAADYIEGVSITLNP